MKGPKLKKSVFILISLLLLLLPVMVFSMPAAKEGVIDVSSWDFEKEGPINLDGQWEFYWQKLIQPDGFNSYLTPSITGYIETPGYWDGYDVKGQKITGTGYATFRLKVINLPADQQWALDIPLMHTAYKLWANGKLISSNGKVGVIKSESVPRYIPKTPVLKGSPEEIEFVLQISNFHHNNGGIWQTVKIGLEKDISLISQTRTAKDLFLFGAIFIMALYHFALFALRPKEGSTMFFGLFCLVISFRLSIHGATIFSLYFPDASWEALVKLDYFTLYFGLSFYCAFIYSLYRLEFSRTILNLIILLSVIWVVFTIVVPARIFTAYLLYYQAIMGVSCLYTLFVLILATIHKRDGARVVLGGCAVIIITLINDILFNHEIVHTGDWVGYGLFIMIFSQSYVLSSKFSKAFEMVEDLSIHLDRMVRERTAAIKDLLDNTGQGFFSFSKDYKVQKYTSKATHEFFGKRIEDENALEIMYPDSMEDKQKLLNLVFENSGNLELVEDILPSEVKKDGRIYSVDYHWIDARDDVDGRVMIVLTDITTQRRLEQQLRIDEERNRMIVKIAVDRHGFIDFINEVNRCLDRIDRILTQASAEIKVDELFRYYHTLKGGMASYNFLDVAEKAHEIENMLATVRNDATLLTQDIIQSVKNGTDQLREILKDSLNGLDQIIPKQLIEAGFQPYFRIAESKINALENLLEKDMAQNQALFQTVKNLRKQPIRNIMKKLTSDAEGLALNLGKKVKINLEGEDTEILHEHYKQMFASLIHLIRNCVDHGIEEPDIRLMMNKPEAGNIDIRFKIEDENMKISISDDGAGIDEELVRTKALERGLINKDQAEAMSTSDIIKLIFSPGFSTAETVTDLSGRGVGMDAVAVEVSKLNGTIDVRTSLGVGTRFTITVPNL